LLFLPAFTRSLFLPFSIVIFIPFSLLSRLYSEPFAFWGVFTPQMTVLSLVNTCFGCQRVRILQKMISDVCDRPLFLRLAFLVHPGHTSHTGWSFCRVHLSLFPKNNRVQENSKYFSSIENSCLVRTTLP
jgi:hypothetical protein